MKKKKTKSKAIALFFLQALLYRTTVHANRLCEGVALMPTQLVLTRAKDQQGIQGSDAQEVGMVDVHTFNHFYTFQVDRDVNERNEGLVMDLINEAEKASTSDGFSFRLRAEFNSAEASRAGMGFKVTLGYKVRDETGYTITTVAEMSSIKNEKDMAMLSIDIPKLPAGKDYQLRYEFGQKEILRNADSLSMQEDSTATSDSVISCNLPFFTQELLLVDSKVLKTRVRKYNQNNVDEELDIQKHAICDFSVLDGEKSGQEMGLQCNSKTYTYPVTGPEIVHVDEDGFALKSIAEYHFRVSGAEGRPITQLFKMTVGTEFAVSAGFRAILRYRPEPDGVLSEYDILHPFACLLNQSCQLGWRQSKNHQSFQVVLTTGSYILQLFDHSKDSVNTWLTEDLELNRVPFTVYLESYPILQNEVRGHCPFMFLLDDFIQQKYIDGQTGQKFHFSDKVIMNLYDQKQQVLIVPELDSIIKIVIREAFGVNALIQLCEQKNEQLDCFQQGTQVGTTEILTYLDLKQDHEYIILIDYTNSILAFHKFDVCPHLPIEISMISVSESTLINANRAEALGMTDKKSRSNLKNIFKKMSLTQAMILDDPLNEGAFLLTSNSEKDFEVLASYDFTVNIKMGLFMEIFYSPYDDEVMELYLGERYDMLKGKRVQADNDQDYDNDDKENLKTFQLNRFKSSKTIWVDLEPGEYTIQILCMRHPLKQATAFYQKVNFQLYIKYDFVNVPREAFLPGNLNYHGLLGVGDETHDYGHVTLFWDDLTLWHKSVSTLFTLSSTMTSLSIQLEQQTDLVKVHLSAFDKEEWKIVGIGYPEVTERARIFTIELLEVAPELLYKIEIFRDSFTEHAQIEEVEMGERYGTSFSLKIDFSEYDGHEIAENLNKVFQQHLPSSMDQIAKLKRSVAGIHEKSFMMGNRNMIHLIEYGDGWQDLVLIPAYVPKDRTLFISKQTDETVVVSIPFEIDGLEEMVYVGIYEYTSGVNLISLHIYDDLTREEVAISRQGKHFSLISGAYLPQGNYQLVIKNDRVKGKGRARQAPLEFVLDVVRHQVPESHEYLTQQLETIQLCQLPHSPESGLSKAGYIHPLSGNQLQTVMQIGVLELDSGSTISFTIAEDSLMTVYIEVAEDIPVVLEISETGGVRKAIGFSTDQDRAVSNFLHQEGFKSRNVVQLREFLAKGSYWIRAKAINEDVLLNFDQRQSFCDTFTMVIGLHPLKAATLNFSPDTEEEFCEEIKPLVNQLNTSGVVRANLVKELTTYSAEVGYFDFAQSNMEGPFLVYFQLDYDMSQEGVMALVISQYDKDLSTFTEVGLYALSDSQSTVLQILERGTYSVSIQSIVSTSHKFQHIGLTNSKLKNMPMLTSHCFKGVYTYLIASANDHDGSNSFFAAKGAQENRVRVMETLDDIRNIREFTTCKHSEMPQRFPISDEGFERQYTFLMSNSAKKVINLIIEEPSLIRVVIKARNPENKIHAHLLKPGEDDHPIAKSDSVHNSLVTAIDPTKKPYILRLIQNELDESDPCPIFDLHIAVKPLKNVLEENLLCVGNKAPPLEFSITEKITKLDVPCGFSDEMIMEHTDPKTGIMDYKINISLPHSDFFFDIQMKNDFLTGNFKMYLFTQDTENDFWVKIAQSELFDENSLEDVNTDAEAQMSTKIGDKTMIHKLRYLEDVSPDLLTAASQFMLRIKVSTKEIIDALLKYQLFTPRLDSLCFNFDLQLFIDEIDQLHKQENEDNKLMRVDWHGQEQSANRFDPSKRIQAFLEFEKSLSKHMGNLADFYEKTIYLDALTPDGNLNENEPHIVIPTHFKMKFQSDDTLVIGFAPFSLLKGICYRLRFNDRPNGALQSIAGMVSASVAESEDLRVCTSACECDTIGTLKCIEAPKGSSTEEKYKCKCHPHFMGDDCSVCEKGYYRNDDGFCEKASLCADLGGDEDCHSHGECNQEGDVAVCDCDEGFTHDGLDQCGRCADPLMHYPNECENRRKWILEEEDFECDTLLHVMPHKLFKDPRALRQGGLTQESQVIYQQRNGNLEWAGRYSLKKPDYVHMAANRHFTKDNSVNNDKQFRKESKHSFFLRQTSMYKLHISTVNSNVKVRFAILNHEKKVVQHSEEFLQSIVAFGILTPDGKPDEAIDKPHTLHIHYEHEHSKYDRGSTDCPKVEIHFVMVPASFHQDSLKCTKDELDQIKGQKLDQNLTFKTNSISTEQRIVMPSLWLNEKDKHLDSILTVDEGHDEKMASIDIKINVERPGIFSTIVATDFSDLNVYMSLKNIDSKQLVSIERSYMLDKVETNDEHINRGEDVSVARVHDEWDHLSAIEIGHLDVGRYLLSLSIPKGHWFIEKDIPTCLTIDLMIDFVPRDLQSTREDEFTSDLFGPVQIMTVFPPSRKDQKLGSELNMMIHLNKSIDVRDAAKKMSDAAHLCRLQNLADGKKYLTPDRYFYDRDTIKLLFDFAKNGDFVNQVFKDNKEQDAAACWKLACKDSPTDEDDIYFKMMPGDQQYCFTGLGADASVFMSKSARCNPFAKAKTTKTGACECTFPYKGEKCEECEKDFRADQQDVKYKGKNVKHTVCVPMDDTDQFECNGFGTYDKKKRICKCATGYAGDNCEMCEDGEQEYPDCTDEFKAKDMDSDVFSGWGKQRREQVKNKDDPLEIINSPFQQQCPYTDFPNFLNSIHTHKEFSTGEFHIADTYTVNHDDYNVIEFTPRMKGLFKIMLKQPEREVALEAHESMIIAIQIMKADGSGPTLTDESNHLIDFSGKGKHTELDFSILEFEVVKELVDTPLLIQFRSVNITHDSETMEPQLCTELFIEIEFRSLANLHKCDSQHPEMRSTKSPIVLKEGSIWPESEQISTLPISEDLDSSFFFSQDFYLEKDLNLKEFEIEVGLAQKFIDQHLILPIVEILETEMDLQDFDANKYKPKKRPECSITCLVGGQKLYNSFTVQVSAPGRTMIRIWLYEAVSLNPVILLEKMNAEKCVNFALNVRVLKQLSPEHEESLKENLYCEHTRYVPKSLNRLRYLGEEGDDGPQQDFDYIEYFRVDNLSHEGRLTKFTLKERTVVRMDGVEHEHLQFFISISKGGKVVSGQEPAKLPGTENYLYPSIFTVLDAGDYVMAISFIAHEAEILRLPCQSIQIQIAMNRADEAALYPREHINKDNISQLNLENISGPHEVLFEATVNPILDAQSPKFKILFDEVILFEERDDKHLAMKATSDFMRADINFVLINVETGHFYQAQHIFEDAKKMIVPELPPGYFRLMIFMQNLEAAGNMTIKPVVFKFHFKLFSFVQRDQTFVQRMTLVGTQESLGVAETIKLLMPFSSPEKLECYGHGRHLPDNLTQDVLLHETDFEFNFAIFGGDLAFIKAHQITYQPEKGEDILRIQIDSGVKAKLYIKTEFDSNGDSADPIAISHDLLGNGMHEMVARDLDHRKTYTINIIFAEDRNDLEVKAQIQCLIAKMDVKIATSQSEFTCLKQERSADLQEKINNQNNTMVLSYKNVSDKGKHWKMVSANDSNNKVKSPKYILDIVDQSTDLVVTIEGSDHLFGSIIQVTPEDSAHIDKDSTGSKRGMKPLVLKVFGNTNALVPASITSPKHMTKYHFMALSAGRYVVHMWQPSKPSDCINLVDVLFQVNQSLESVLIERFTTGTSQQVRYQSKTETGQGLLKLPTSMPVQLDSFRFLGGGTTEDRYVLFSDTYMLGENELDNSFRLGKLKNNVTYVRIFLEDSTLGLNLTCIDASTQKQFKLVQPTRFIESHLPEGSECSIGLFHLTKQHLNRRLYLRDMVRVTVMVANRDFTSDKYLKNHKESLAACTVNQWPLALEKNMDKNTNSDEQSYYDYPLVRYPIAAANQFRNLMDFEMNSYYFRFNETQRFYFEVGSNFVVNHAVLKLTPTQKAFGSYEIFGKQLGNINVLDLDVPAGDYQLTVQAYHSDTSNGECGLFSMRGLLNMHSAMDQHLPGSSHIGKGATVCQIKNSAEAPGQIFASESKTRKGNEAVIDPEGNFFQYYQDLLIVKSHHQVVEPWTHEILLEVLDTSFLQVTLKSELAENMLVKVYSKALGTQLQPAVTTLSETNSYVNERKAVFKLDGKKAYIIEIEFSGDVYNRQGDENPCGYFDLTISINSLKALGEKLACKSHESIQNSQSLLEALPSDIGKKDLNFKLDNLYTFKYPEDFKPIRLKSNGKQSAVLLLPTVISVEDPFSVQSAIGFDVNMADFVMSLVQFETNEVQLQTKAVSESENLHTDGLPIYEVLARSSPLINLKDNDDETFLREITETHIRPSEEDKKMGMQYMLAIEEKQAFYIFNEIAKEENIDSLCLPVIFKLKVNLDKKPQNGLIGQNDGAKTDSASTHTPSVIDFKFLETESHARENKLVVPYNVPRLSAVALLTNAPHEDQRLHEQAFLIAFKADETTLIKFMPANIRVKEIQMDGHQLFEVQLDYRIDLSSVRKEIVGADGLTIWLEINAKAIHSEEDGSIFTIQEVTQDKLSSSPIIVELPEDLQAKKESSLKEKGKQVKDSLYKAIKEMERVKKAGKKYPKELEDKLMQLQERGIENVSPQELFKFATTMETLSNLQNWDTSVVTEDEVLKVICGCVNGSCDQGESICSKCYKGWHGRMCDIADAEVDKDKRKNPKAIQDEEDDEQIFNPKKRTNENDNGQDQIVGRRKSAKKDAHENEYKPRQAYSNPTKIDDAEDHEEEPQDKDVKSKKKSQSSAQTNGRQAKLITDDHEPSTPKTNKPTVKKDINAEKKNKTEEQGFFSWVFSDIIWLVGWLVYIIVGAVCLLLLKAGCETMKEKVQAANQKKRKGKRQRQRDADDGMGFVEQGHHSSEGEKDDEPTSPIEMVAFNRKTSKGLKKHRSRAKAESNSSNSDSVESKEGKVLKLFDQDEEEGTRDAQPQDPVGGSTDYNPFQETATADLLDSEVFGQAMVNEIDDALNEESDDDEFGQFV